MRTTTRRVAAVLAVPTIALAALVGPANAHGGGDDDRIIRRGNCTGGTDWKIKAKSDDGRIEVEAEIDSNRVGQTWGWKFKHNGAVFSKGMSTTKAPSGSFEVERKPANLAGTDHFVFRATHAGQVCRGTIAY